MYTFFGAKVKGQGHNGTLEENAESAISVNYICNFSFIFD